MENENKSLLDKDENLNQLIKQKLQTLVDDKEKTIRKVFNFSLEELQDNPRKTFATIRNYLRDHADKIEDFWFDSYVDENTFMPILVLHVLPVETVRNHLINTHWKHIADLNIIPYTIEDNVTKIFNSFLFEFNDYATRTQLSAMIEQLIKLYTVVDFRIVDKTEEDSTSINLVISSEYGETSLNEFLFILADNNKLSYR
jgi:hypothetical protein